MTHGSLAGTPVGARFRNRRSLYDAGIHRDIRRGICGSGIPGLGVESVVVSGGYEDDLDLGEVVYYTGMGGRDKSGRQIADQELTGLNRSLADNVDSAVPVRVVRAVSGEFEYSGLYLVEDAVLTVGQSGHLICRYRLRAASSIPVGSNEEIPDAPLLGPLRRDTTHYRLVRDGKMPTMVKRLYDYCCQICGIRLETLAGPYAEGAHLVPLGGGADGPDHMSNLLCLCPNHHVLLDHGAIYFDVDWRVLDRNGHVLSHLNIHPNHPLDSDLTRIHRRLFDAG